MKYRKIGKHGVKISEISLGSWLTYGQTQGKEATVACVKKAFDLGINHIDTADAYGMRHTKAGDAEALLGEVLADYPRTTYVLATKTGYPMGPTPNEQGLSRKHIIEQCERSLRRLKTDYVDIYYCHKFDGDTPIDETLRAIDDLVRQGKVLYPAISTWSAAQTVQALRVADVRRLDPVIVNQLRYNLLDRAVEKEMMPLCRSEGLGLIVFSPLAMGILTGKYTDADAVPADSRAADPKSEAIIRGAGLNAQTLAKVNRLKQIAETLGISVAQLSLAWILHHPEVSSAIVGATKPEQLEDNAAASGITLDAQTVKEVEDVFGV